MCFITALPKFKKNRVVVVIILLMGVSLAPCVHANIQQEPLNSKLVEITTEFCGLQNGQQTVQLTPQEALDLDVLFDTLQMRLEDVESKKETIQIFKEAIIELDEYGLLGGLSVQQVQRLVLGRYQWKLASISLEENENKNCLILGKTTWTKIHGFILRFLAFAYQNIWNLLPYSLWVRLLLLIGFTEMLNDHRPVFLDANIFFAKGGTNGRVWTKGVNGVVSWNGSLWGRIQIRYGNASVVGFKGLNIMINKDSTFTYLYLGYARHVKIDYFEPYRTKNEKKNTFLT